MKSILGISAFYHDSAACILQNGKIIAAAQEERFTRIKHDPSYPYNAIKFVWKYWQNKGTPRKTILVRKGSFHSGSITGWKMTIDTMRWTKHIPDVNYVDFYDKDFNDVWKWSVKNPELFWSKFWDY